MPHSFPLAGLGACVVLTDNELARCRNEQEKLQAGGQACDCSRKGYRAARTADV